MAFVYIPGYGYASKEVHAYQDALGQTHFGSGGVYNEDGTLARGKLISADGTVSNFGRNPNYTKAQSLLSNSGTSGNNAVQSLKAIGKNAVYDASEKPKSASDLIAKWKRGESLNPQQIEVVRQYLMRQGYYIGQGDGDIESFNAALSGYVASQNNQQQAANSQSWGFPGGGSTTIGKNDSKSKKMTNSSNWNRATTHESDVRLRRDLRS